MSDDRPASVAAQERDQRPDSITKKGFLHSWPEAEGQGPWHILSGYDLEFAGMSTRERVRVMLEWSGRRQTIALPINSVVGCPDCAHKFLYLSLIPGKLFGANVPSTSEITAEHLNSSARPVMTTDHRDHPRCRASCGRPLPTARRRRSVPRFRPDRSSNPPR